MKKQIRVILAALFLASLCLLGGCMQNVEDENEQQNFYLNEETEDTTSYRYIYGGGHIDSRTHY